MLFTESIIGRDHKPGFCEITIPYVNIPDIKVQRLASRKLENPIMKQQFKQFCDDNIDL